MRRDRTRMIGGAATLTALSLAWASAAQPPAAFPTLDVRVPVAPAPAAGAGRTHLAYELHIANLSGRPTTIDAVDVRDRAAAPGAAPLLHLEGATLEAAMRRPAAAPDDKDKRLIPGGRVALVFIWVTLAEGAAMPTALTHRIATRVGDPPAAPAPAASASTGAAGNTSSGGNSDGSANAGAKATGASASSAGVAIVIEGPSVSVAARAPRLIGPPLRGEHWLAANGPGNDSGHRRALIALDGEGHIAQRFAIDWVQMHANGKTSDGDPLKNASYRCHGADALAVADGIVSDTHDGIPENVPGIASRAVPITPETVGGNYVILDIGQGAFAFYAHLQPGSLKVKTGDKVRRGQVLGLVGNTGNSTEPHLHFHLSDRNSPLGSEGLPYTFDTFDLQVTPQQLAKAAGSDAGELGMAASVWTGLLSAPAQARRREMPMQNDIIKFPAR